MSNPDATHFGLAFTPGELFWLLSAFGYTPPAFLGQPIAPQPAGQARQIMLSGAQSLLARQLIRPLAGSPTYQIESTLAALLHWLCNSERVISLQRIRREGGPQPLLVVCLTDGPALLVEIELVNYRLTLFKNNKALLPALTKCLGLPADFSTLAVSASILPTGPISLPEPETILPLAWQNPAAARPRLEQQAMSGEQITNYLSWAADQSQLVTVSINNEIDSYFTFGKQSAWRAQPAQAAQSPITFSPLSREIFSKSFRDLF